MSNKRTPTLKGRGNPIANHPLMRKGGRHKTSRTSKRQQHKRDTRQLVSKYMGIKHSLSFSKKYKKINLSTLSSKEDPVFFALSRGVAQPGSAPQWGCGGRVFESLRPDHI